MADDPLPDNLGRAAWEAESAWLDEFLPGPRTPWDDLDPEVRDVYGRIAGTVAAAERERIAGRMDELAARNAMQAATGTGTS